MRRILSLSYVTFLKKYFEEKINEITFTVWSIFDQFVPQYIRVTILHSMEFKFVREVEI